MFLFINTVLLRLRMPFKGEETPHCPRCGHAAFQAESIPAAGKMWHKICFRCGTEKKIFIYPF